AVSSMVDLSSVRRSAIALYASNRVRRLDLDYAVCGPRRRCQIHFACRVGGHRLPRAVGHLDHHAHAGDRLEGVALDQPEAYCGGFTRGLGDGTADRKWRPAVHGGAAAEQHATNPPVGAQLVLAQPALDGAALVVSAVGRNAEMAADLAQRLVAIVVAKPLIH